ncbi:MAG: hypothetical protein EBT67_12865 [Betaproteobacteria bacterium]|nr:hypothetical protein [Betaproteobacteria bacterium]
MDGYNKGRGVKNERAQAHGVNQPAVIAYRGADFSNAQSVRVQGHLGWRFGGAGGALRVQSLNNACQDVVRTL